MYFLAVVALYTLLIPWLGLHAIGLAFGIWLSLVSCRFGHPLQLVLSSLVLGLVWPEFMAYHLVVHHPSVRSLFGWPELSNDESFYGRWDYNPYDD